MTYTDEELLDALRTFADAEYDHDRAPTQADVRAREDLPATSTFIYRFGSWSAAVKAAGFAPRLPRWSDDDLRALAESGMRPTQATVADREDMASPATYENRFGSWSGALDAADLPTFDSDEE